MDQFIKITCENRPFRTTKPPMKFATQEVFVENIDAKCGFACLLVAHYDLVNKSQ